MSGVELACRDVVEMVTDYLEGTLDPVIRDDLERHLAECEGCEAYLEQLHATIRLGGRPQADDVPTPVMDALLEAFRKA